MIDKGTFHTLELRRLPKYMVTPNWYYFSNAPLDSGTIQFRTKTERALYALVIACEINWKEYQTSSLLDKWIKAKKDLEIYQNSLQMT